MYTICSYIRGKMEMLLHGKDIYNKMNKNMLKWHRIALFGVAFFSLALAVFRTVLTLTAYDSTLGHFTSGFAAEVGFPLLLICATAFTFFIAVLLKSKAPTVALPQSPVLVFASAFTAVCTAAWLLDTAIALLPASMPLTGKILLFLSLLSSVGLIVYAVLCALPSPPAAVRTLAGAATSLFCVFYAMLAYFHTGFTLNSPIKQYDQITFLVLALFFLTESQIFSGKKRPLLYLFFCGAASCLCAADSLPGLVYALVNQTPLLGSAMHDFLLFALFLYTLARFFTLSFPVPAKDEPESDGDKPHGTSGASVPRASYGSEDDPRFDTSAHTTIDFEQK